jgi:hypothetical protein
VKRRDASLGVIFLTSLARANRSAAHANTPAGDAGFSDDVLHEEHGLSEAQIKERRSLLAEGERVLQGLRAQEALEIFERAALISHSPDAELGVVRSHLQNGAYSRALAFCAHTAGAHEQAHGCSALYAWLLRIGGYTEQAAKYWAATKVRAPSYPLLTKLGVHLENARPLSDEVFAKAPLRFLPYAQKLPRAKQTKAMGAALLMNDGVTVLALSSQLDGESGEWWVRTSLGEIARASPTRRERIFTTLQLSQVTKLRPDVRFARKSPFPGSVAFWVQHADRPAESLAWPVLAPGFLGDPRAEVASRQLSIKPGLSKLGGPVFDQFGRVIGLADGRKGKDRGQADVILTSEMSKASVMSEYLSDAQNDDRQTERRDAPPKLSTDQIYEMGLRSTVEIFRLKGALSP